LARKLHAEDGRRGSILFGGEPVGTVNSALRPRAAFILLEVMVAIVIIGVAMVALMRGFIVSLDSLQRIKQNETAILLARSLMDDLILEPPPEDRLEGKFANDPRFGDAFAGWEWEMEVE